MLSLVWDELAEKASRQERFDAEQSRQFLTVVRTAVDDAVNSATPLGEGLSADLAGAAAAHRVITTLLPSHKDRLDRLLEKDFQAAPDSEFAERAYSIGRSAADSALRSQWKFKRVPRPHRPLPALTGQALPERQRFRHESLKLHRDTTSP